VRNISEMACAGPRDPLCTPSFLAFLLPTPSPIPMGPCHGNGITIFFCPDAVMDDPGGGDVGPDWVVARYFWGHDVTFQARHRYHAYADICQQ